MALKIANHATKVCRTNIQKRHVHETKSHQYAKEYFKTPSHFDQFQSLAKIANVHLYPKTVTTILKAESTLCEQGFVTGVHAAPSVFTPAIQLATKCELAKSKSTLHKTIDTFAVTRDPGSLDDHYTQMMHILQVLSDQTNPHPDWIPKMSDRVVSMNYGLFTNIVKGESAYYFGFRNWCGAGTSDPDFAKNKAKSMIELTLKHYGLANKEITEIVHSKELNELLRGFYSLNTGNFLVHGIPRGIAKKALYDSRPYGIPTGADALQVFDGIEGKDRITSHQARLVLSKETMDPNSGIVVLSPLDEDAVDLYLMKNKQKAFIPPYAYEEFKEILPVASTEVENDEIGKRKVLLEKSRLFASSVFN